MASVAKNKGTSWWQPALVISLKFSGWIIFPVLIAILLGQWLDRRQGTEPWLFLACVGVAFIVSLAGLIKNVLAEYKKIELANQEKKNKKDNDTN